MSVHRYGTKGNEILVEQVRSRKRAKEGDIFVIKVINGLYYWGRLISTSAYGGMGEKKNDYIIYIYNVGTLNHSEVPNLDKRNLLIPPFFFGSTLWTTGYGVTIENRKLEEADLIEKHYFYDFIAEAHRDEHGNKVNPPNNDVPKVHIGAYGIPSLGVIDQEIRGALKIA